MSSLSNRTPGQVAALWVAAYNSHDADVAAALYDEKVVNVQIPWETSIHGRDAMRSTYQRVFQAFPDLSVEIENQLESGQEVAVEWHFRGTMRGSFAGHPPSGSAFSLRGCELFQIKAGMIVGQRGYWDKATLFRQLKLG